RREGVITAAPARGTVERSHRCEVRAGRGAPAAAEDRAEPRAAAVHFDGDRDRLSAACTGVKRRLRLPPARPDRWYNPRKQPERGKMITLLLCSLAALAWLRHAGAPAEALPTPQITR